jgi:tetratricopeptide (TPR) repeat protein
MPVVWSMDVAGVWVLALFVSLWLLAQVGEHPRGETWIFAGLCAAVVGSLVHGLLGFALLTPGGLSVFVLCAAASVAGARDSARSQRRRWTELLTWTIAAAALLGHVAFVSVRASRTAAALERLDQAMQMAAETGRFRSVIDAARAVAERTPGDAAAARTAARALLRVEPLLPAERERESLLSLADTLCQTAVSRNPLDTNNRSLWGHVEAARANLEAEAGRFDSAVAARRRAAEQWQQATDTNPTDPRVRISAGSAWLELWRRSGARRDAELARGHFREALRIDGLRSRNDSARLRPQERDLIERALTELATQGDAEPAGKPAPA